MLERILTGLVSVPFVVGAAAAPVGHAHVVCSFQDNDIVESSGLAVIGDLLVTTNDSGDSGRVFAVVPQDCRTVSETDWEDDPTDVEALAPDGRGGVWVGDIGDNTGSRDTIQVADVPVTTSSTQLADVTVFDLAYPDGPHDAETLMADPVTGRLYVATKEVFGGTLYAAPAGLSPDRVNRLHPVGDVLPIATDGAFLPDGKHVVVRDYGEAVVYAFPSLEKVAHVRLPAQQQGEGLAVDGDRLLLSSEGLHSKVLQIPLPALADAPAPGPSPSGPTQASPTTRSREDADLPQATGTDRPAWPWLVGGLVGLGCLVVLVRSLRPR